MNAAPAEFYDQLLTDQDTLSLAPLERSPWLPLYQQAAALIQAGARVVELGCGTGRFARLLDDRGDLASYVGIDFSTAAIAEARRYNTGGAAAFVVGDLRTIPIPAADVYVTLEVLEHLDDDLGLLARLPAGAAVVLSVPSYDSDAHVRVFPGLRDVAGRYRDVVSLGEMRSIPLDRDPSRFWHLAAGRR